jgi:hypothetical protein
MELRNLMPTEGKSSPLRPFICVWLAISVLLNVSGMASIVDGFVVWGGFIQDFIGLYRHWIREPTHGVLQLLWPWGPLPRWVADWALIGGSFSVANSIDIKINTGISSKASLAVNVVAATLGTLLHLLFGPLAIVMAVLPPWPLGGRDRRKPLYWSLMLGIVVLLMFLNWQVKRAGVW